MAITEDLHRFSTDAYLQIMESGSLATSRVELLDGLIVDMTPQGERHVYAIQSLSACFSGSPWMLRIQMPLEVGDGWVPEPDLAITPRQTTFDRPPTSAYLVVEIAVSSKTIDLRKAAAYAGAGIPTYWLVDVPARTVFAYTEPRPDGYGLVTPLRDRDVLDAGLEGMAPTTADALFAD